MIRLFIDAELTAGGRIVPRPDQAHYLIRVMRRTVGERLLLFNGRDGEWRASLVAVGKRGCVLCVEAPLRPQVATPDLDLIVALVKRARLETIVEKAAELGAGRVRLAITERTNAERANMTRLAAIATEASEQTGRLDVPAIMAPERLATILGGMEAGRRLLFCDEADDVASPERVLGGLSPGGWSVLVGPEGGFSAEERSAIRGLARTTAISLGPRILRADTAAIAALALWQSTLGDWRGLELGRAAGQVTQT